MAAGVEELGAVEAEAAWGRSLSSWDMSLDALSTLQVRCAGFPPLPQYSPRGFCL